MRVKHFPTQLRNRLPLLKQQIVPEYYPNASGDPPKPVPKEIQQGLIIAFRELMANTNTGLDYPFSGLGDLLRWYQDIENCKAESTASIQRTITGKITALPFVASLVEPKDKIPVGLRAKYDCYHRLIFIACMQLWILDNHQSAILSALREWRLTAEEPERHTILDVLPDPFTYQDIATLRTDLNTLSQEPEPEFTVGTDANHKAKSSPNRSIKKEMPARIRTIYIVIHDAIQQSGGKTFTKISTVLKDNTEQVSIHTEPLPPLDDSGDQLAEIRIQPKEKPDEPRWHGEETQSSQPDIAIYQYEPAQPITKDRRLRALQGKRLCEQLAIRNLSLPCQFEQLSDWDIRHLVSKLTTDLTGAVSHDQAIAATLLCSLCFGLQVPQLIKLSANRPQSWIELKQGKDGQSHLALHRAHTIPGNNPPLETAIPLPKTRTDFYLPLSDHLLTWFNHQPQWHQNEQELKSYLQEINEKQTCRLSLGRIARYLTHWGMNQGMDTLYLALIRSEPVHKLPSLSYSQWQISSLLDVWYLYINALFTGQPVAAALPARKAFEQTLGSRLHLPDVYLSGLFFLQKRLVQPISSSDLSERIQYHNRYVAYIWLLLCVATGHRPVNAPFGFCTDGSQISGHWWISDKERRAGLAARTLVLPETAIKQITLYLTHLRTLIQYFKLLNPDLARHLQQALDGEQNLFFLIEEKASTPDQPYWHHPLEITPGRLKEQLGKSMPYPMNWYRHHDRSYLMKARITPQLIDCWMGHEELGAEGLGAFSGLSLKDYQHIATELENLFKQHQIGAIAGCQIL